MINSSRGGFSITPLFQQSNLLNIDYQNIHQRLYWGAGKPVLNPLSATPRKKNELAPPEIVRAKGLKVRQMRDTLPPKTEKTCPALSCPAIPCNVLQ